MHVVCLSTLVFECTGYGVIMSRGAARMLFVYLALQFPIQWEQSSCSILAIAAGIAARRELNLVLSLGDLILA